MKDDERSLVDAVVSSINGGVFDHYLKAIVDATIARKRVLSQHGEVPSQFRIALTPKPPILDEEYEEDDEEPTPPPRKPVARKVASPSQTFTGSGTVITGVSGVTGAVSLNHNHVAVSQGPDPSSPVSTIKIAPLTLVEQQSIGEDSYVVLHGYAYLKRAFYRTVVQVGDLFGVSDQRVMVIGIGKKQLKVLYVNEPPRGTLHGENPHQKWMDGEEDYLDRSYVDPLLAQPPFGQEHEYRTT